METIDYNEELFVPGKIRTFSGKYINPCDPDLDLICIEDIAHALAQLPRYGGHLNKHYSVGQHSLHVTRLLPKELKLVGLLHDATEAYLGGDIPSPVKYLIPGYKAIENKLLKAILTRFNCYELYAANYDTVKAADIHALKTEWDVLVMNRKNTCPYFSPAKTWYTNPKRVEEVFLRNFVKHESKEKPF